MEFTKKRSSWQARVIKYKSAWQPSDGRVLLPLGDGGAKNV